MVKRHIDSDWSFRIGALIEDANGEQHEYAVADHDFDVWVMPGQPPCYPDLIKKVASREGDTWHNCRKDGNAVIIEVSAKTLLPCKVWAKVTLHVADPDCEDGVREITDAFPVGVQLTDGKCDQTGVVDVEVLFPVIYTTGYEIAKKAGYTGTFEQWKTLVENMPTTAQDAKDAGDYAKTQGDHAKAQGDYAKEQGDTAGSAATNADQKATEAHNAALATNEAKQMAINAMQAAQTQMAEVKNTSIIDMDATKTTAVTDMTEVREDALLKIGQAFQQATGAATQATQAAQSANSAAEDAREAIAGLPAMLNAKVDKVEGKGLSTNDYTNADKQKLDGVAPGAEQNVQADWMQGDPDADSYIKNKPTIPTPYNLPMASREKLGGVKVGRNLTIDSDGTLNATGGGGGGGTSDYNDLENKPQINGNTLVGNKASADLGLMPKTDIIQDVTQATESNLLSAKATNDGMMGIMDACLDAIQMEMNERNLADVTEATARQQADNALQLALNGKLAKLNHNDKAYTYVQFKGWLSDANANTGQPSCCGIIKFAAGQCPLNTSATKALQCNFIWLCEKQDGTASTHGECILYPADWTGDLWGTLQRVASGWKEIAVIYSNILARANTWSAANNFTGGLTKSGVNVATATDISNEATDRQSADNNLATSISKRIAKPEASVPQGYVPASDGEGDVSWSEQKDKRLPDATAEDAGKVVAVDKQGAYELSPNLPNNIKAYIGDDDALRELSSSNMGLFVYENADGVEVSRLMTGAHFQRTNAEKTTIVKVKHAPINAHVTSLESAFLSISTLEEVDLRGCDVSNVTTMYQCFNNVPNLKRLELGDWHTPNLHILSYFCYYNSALEYLDIHNFYIEPAETIVQWLYACSSLRFIRLGANCFNHTPFQLNEPENLGLNADESDNGWLAHLVSVAPTQTTYHTIQLPSKLKAKSWAATYLTALQNKGYTIA